MGVTGYVEVQEEKNSGFVCIKCSMTNAAFVGAQQVQGCFCFRALLGDSKTPKQTDLFPEVCSVPWQGSLKYPHMKQKVSHPVRKLGQKKALAYPDLGFEY